MLVRNLRQCWEKCMADSPTKDASDSALSPGDAGDASSKERRDLDCSVTAGGQEHVDVDLATVDEKLLGRDDN